METSFVFFLGGYDAEMVVIKEILEEKKLDFKDKKLSWGAKLSEYEEELKKLPEDKIPVIIELELDIPYPDNSIIIDHHNEKAGANKKTSIEQVADLLKIELNRWQQLVSINDKAYIDGMIDFGATQTEIDEVRAFDRKCQGITEDDEKLAELSIKYYCQEIPPDGVYILSMTDKTSPIFDRLYKYYRHIFINTVGNKFNYSGTGKVVKNFVSYFQELEKNHESVKFWYGGNLPFSGYFGSNIPITIKNIYEINKGIFK
ncbi:hypothetical protein [Rosettibacter firmus]|uniref:hypothetical protein n=1 Tax=Rosettibacter firmus TaxID=3111522 RepID=UPI00336C2C79